MQRRSSVKLGERLAALATARAAKLRSSKTPKQVTCLGINAFPKRPSPKR